MTRVLVTGASGFIGRPLVSAIRAQERYTVQTIDSRFGDISRYETWDRLPPSDVVIHLAALANVPRSWDNTSSFIETNCLGIARTIDYCLKHKSKLIWLSSFIYDSSATLPFTETSPLKPTNPYALTKYFSDLLVQLFQDKLSHNAYILRPFNVYGPGQSADFLIPNLIMQSLSSEPISVSDLKPRRDFIYIDDLVQAIISLISYQGDHHIFNIGTGSSTSIEEVINIISNLLGKKLEISTKFSPRINEIMDTVSESTLARQELDWVPKTSLTVGISQVIKSLSASPKL